MKHKVLQALADRMQTYFRENPEVAEAMAEQAEQMKSLCSIVLTPQVKKAIDNIRLKSGLHNLN